MKKQAGAVALLLSAILVVSLGITALTYTKTANDAPFTVTAAFYPMYTAALQVVGEASGVSVSCLTAPTAGCLHDYQLSPDEMTALIKTDVLILNGVGAEGFLDNALKAYPSIRTVDTSVGVPTLSACDDHAHHDHEHGENEHIWLSPARYYKQVENLRDGLCAADPARAALYTKNAAAYLEKIAAVQEQMQWVRPYADGAVLFHDSVAYVANDWGLSVLASLPLGEDTALSAHTLAAATEAVRGKQVIALYDNQYADTSLAFDTYAAGVRRVVWDTAVSPKAGVDDRERWLAAMEYNVKELAAR